MIVAAHPFMDLFADLTREMSEGGAPIVHDLGTSADAEHTSAERCIWIPTVLGVQVPPFSLGAGASPYRQRWVFDVSLYADSPLRLGDIHASLAGNLDLLIGPPDGVPPSPDGSFAGRPGYAISDGSPGPRGGDLATSGWGMVTQVTLYRPVYSVVYGRAPILSVDRTAIAEGPNGETPEKATETLGS